MNAAQIHQHLRRFVDAAVQAEVVDADAQRTRRRILRCAMDEPARAPLEIPRIGRFVIVGCVAAAVHWLGVVAIVSQWQWRPLAANVPAWLLALAVSFAGHRGWTFGDHDAPLGASLRRFTLVSAGGFAINQSAYALLLRWSPWHYGVLLAVVLVAVAALTYLASRHWAFLRN
jgi:putative flippase GtrA